MSNVPPEPTPKPPSGSPFGKFQTVGVLAAVVLALLIAVPYISDPDTGAPGGDPAPTPTTGGGDPSATPPTPEPSPEPTPAPTAEPTPAPTAAPTPAYEDCLAQGAAPEACEALRGPGSEALAKAYLSCRAAGRPAQECLVEASG